MLKRLFALCLAAAMLTSCLGGRQPSSAVSGRTPTASTSAPPASPPVAQPPGATPVHATPALGEVTLVPGEATPASGGAAATFSPATLAPRLPGAPVIDSIGEAAALPLADPLYQQMLRSGYSLFQAGTIRDEAGGAYSAYLFTRFEVGEPVGATTFQIAFFHSDGAENRLLGTLSPPAYSMRTPAYPSYYRLAHWDDPARSQMGLAQVTDPDAATRTRLGLSGQAADINANGLPEFIFGAEYCPTACVSSVQGFDFFEVGPEGITRLGEDLEARLELIPASNDPLVFKTADFLPFGRSTRIELPGFAEWDGAAFRDVTRSSESLMAAPIAAHRARLEAQYGKSFATDEAQASAYALLLLYERLGLRREALDAFLDVTDPARWTVENERVLCWMQLARAQAQRDYAANRPFTPLTALSDFDLHAEVPALAAAPAPAGVDFSACARWNR